jgi:8-oxo-dGTP pyrophosphatase MutT (NUDIX family)
MQFHDQAYDPYVAGMLSATPARVGTVDVYVIHIRDGAWRVLVLQRSATTRCPGAWETVHGRIEPGERPEEAARRELREETGLAPDRLYAVTVQPFYMARVGVVDLAVVFAAFVRSDGVTTADEHSAYEWLSTDEALQRFHWPREAAALREAMQLLRDGTAGPAEDVLRV